MNEIFLKLPIPPSVNGAYAGTVRRYKSEKYKAWIVEAHLANKDNKKFKIVGDEWLEIYVTFYTPLFNKGNGKKKKWDLDNRLKTLFDFIDSVIEGLDDHKYKRIIAQKVDSPRKEVEVSIKELREGQIS